MYLLAACVCLMSGFVVSGTRVVTDINPNYVSTEGGARITIVGSGFTHDLFNFGTDNEEKSVEVNFFSADGKIVPCDIHKDGCTMTQITCYTRKMEHDVPYTVSVKVNGQLVTELCTATPENCVVRGAWYYTPRINDLNPQSGKPGNVILTVYGRIITERFGSNSDVSSNGRNEAILRSYTTSNCELKNGTEKTDFYGLYIDNDLSGYLKCKPEGTFVGNTNYTFLVEAPFGRSAAEWNVSRVSRTDDIYMIQFYADISSLSPTQGGTEGGTLLTINGDLFETAGPLSTYRPLEVYVGGEECKIQEVVKDSYVTCLTPAKPVAKSVYRGNRGVTVEVFGTSTFTSNADAISSTAAPSANLHLDETRLCGGAHSDKWRRMKGIFVAAWDGKFQFQMQATPGGAVKADGYNLLETTGAVAYGQLMDLKKGDEVPFVAVAAPSTDPAACAEVRMAHMNTKFSNSMIGRAMDEKQRLVFTSTVVNEVQTVSLSVSKRAATQEKQKICDPAGESFQLCIYNVCTESATFSAGDIAEKLNKLPFLASGETFTATENANCIDILFQSERGNIPQLEVVMSGSMSVSTVTEGAASGNVFSFMFNGVPSQPITYNATDTAATATAMQTALKEMFGVRCPTKFITPVNGFYDGFENGATGTTTEVAAFCGRYSLMNTENIYSTGAGKLISGKHFCFAVKGLDNNKIYLKFNEMLTNRGTWTTFTPFLVENTWTGINDDNNTWVYTCVSLEAVFRKAWPAVINYADFTLVQVKLEMTDPTNDFYVDNVMITSNPVLSTDKLTKLRMPGAQPSFIESDPKFTMADVTVTYDVAKSNYVVTMKPNECGHNFRPLTVDDAQSGAVTMTSSSVTKASNPITGSFTLTSYGRTSEPVNPQYTDKEMQSVLVHTFGKMNVERTADSTCANMKIDVSFLEMPGDLDLMNLATSFSAPSSATGSIEQQVPGHLSIVPIPGDMVFTQHTTPQVTVYVNGVPSKCALANNDCSFTYSAVGTPTVTGISPNTGNENVMLTVTGTGFSGTLADNKVTIGNVPCTVTAATTTEIRCTLGNGPLGSYPVVVSVSPVGRAVNTASNFTYTADVVSIAPTSAGLGGNMDLVVTGTGITSGATVSVGGVNCPVKSVQAPTTITCVLPQFSDLTSTTSQTAVVVVTLGGTELVTKPQFTYTPQNSQITSVSPSGTLGVAGNNIIDITGTNLGTVGTVFLGDRQLEVISYSPTAIQVRTPSPSPTGDNIPLMVYATGSLGAVLNTEPAVPVLSIPYKVQKVFPTSGSLMGGTRLTVVGSGFGTVPADIKAHVGDYSCIVMTTTNTKFICEIESTSAEYDITNMGTTGFGAYFAFSQTELRIEEGDSVRWAWQTAGFLNNVQHGVYQTESLSSTEALTGGISSGNQTRQGSFQHVFNSAGTYYFWSGYVDQWDIKDYRMVVNVVPKAAKLEQFAMSIEGAEPVYETSSGVADPTDNSGCATRKSDIIPGCTPETLTPQNTDRFNFLFSKCRTPTLTGVTFTDAVQGSPRSAKVDTAVSVSGTEFATGDCANVASIGGCECIVSGSTTTSLVCTPNPSCEYELGVLLPVNVNIVNYGFAKSTISSEKDQSLAFLPSIQSINPSSGSKKGGTEVTILGSGLTNLDAIKVTFNDVAATCTSVQPLVCQSPLSNTGDVAVVVSDFPAICSGASCLFTYDVVKTPTVTAVSPATLDGNVITTLTISGTSFGTDSAAVFVKIGGEDCGSVLVESDSSATCSIRAVPAGANQIIVNVDGMGNADSSGKTVTGTARASVTPTAGATNGGTKLTFTGHGFKGETTVTTNDGVACTDVKVASLTELTCISGPHAAGAVNFVITSHGEMFPNVEFTYDASLVPTISAINPASGDSLGNQLLTLTGSHFYSGLAVTVCGGTCTVNTQTATEIVCITPAKADVSVCDVILTGSGVTATSTTQYTYIDNDAPRITSLNPQRGGTGGGTTLTISGTGLSGATVSIYGKECTVSSSTASQIVCSTGAQTASVQADVLVTAGGKRAVPGTLGASSFYYVDLYSSGATWGGGPVPGEGDMVVIPQGQIVLLDQSTEILGMLLIDGGQLIFDEKDLTLKAERILITKGGKLQVGSPERRFQQKAVIELYGHQRDEEMPIYGTKVLAVRDGELNLYGKEINNTWTRLASTANAGAATITVQDDISDWSVGDSIVVATTGDHFSQGESEEHLISAKSGQTITLTTALKFKHLGVTETFNGVDGATVKFDYRAEVGLLTRNIVVRGNEDPQWTRDIQACAAGFDPGEFVTQTCFEGRFGEEKGNSQFGGQVLIHQTEKDTQVAQAHLSYAEFTFAGQAFRLGRYPIHFHLNGNMSKSFVEGCAIHKTFNRAINIHGSHNINIRKNVAFNILGGAFFLEDGIEVNNTYDRNLIVFVRASSSLLNDDITPAAYWATNPYNTYTNNVAVGGTHFGWWYRMKEFPDGPSFTTTYCPVRVPLKEHSNNEAHSNGWFGIWTFAEYYPVKGGACSGTTGAEPAVFRGFKAYNNEKGIEFVDFSSLQVIDSVLVQNSFAGYEGKRVINGERRNPATSATVNNTLIVGKSMLPDVQNAFGSTQAGVILPYGESQQLHKVKFLNFPDDAANGDSAVAIKFTKIDGTCSDKCGGFNYQTSGLQFENTPYRIHFRWAHEGIIEDTDGSLCGTPNSKVLPNWETYYNAPGCSANCTGKFKNNDMEFLEPLVCPATVKFHRLAFNNIKPASLKGKNLTLTSQHGSSVGFFRVKRITHKDGWMAVLMGGETTTITFEGAEEMTNISFTGQINELEAGDCLILTLRVLEKPDIVALNGQTGKNQSAAQFTCAQGPSSGDWWFNPANNHVEFAVTGPARSKRGSVRVFNTDIKLDMKIEKCYFAGCVPPTPKDKQEPPTERPNPFNLWNEDIWTRDQAGLVRSNGTGVMPATGENVLITEDKWIVIKTTTAIELGTVRVEGGLEIDYNSEGVTYEFKVKFLIIIGGRFHVGWPNNPMLGTANIVLLGNAMSPAYTEIEGIAIGNKAIAVFGGLELHGRDVGESYTLLTQTANIGDTILKVTGDDIKLWRAGDTVVVTSTSLIPTELETVNIASVDSAAGTVTLTSPLKYQHTFYSETLNGTKVTLAAAVGHVTRNIIIQGERTDTNQAGGRVIASVTQVTVGSGAETRTGYIRARYAKFDFMGQDGYTESYDPRFAIAYVATGPVNDVKPSLVQGCAFVSLDSTAVGAFGATDLEISNNVVVNPVGNGIVTTSDNTRIENNLVANLLWTGSYDGRNEPFNIRYEAGIYAIGSHGLHMADNYVAGSERVGYRVPGQDCDDPYTPAVLNYAVGNLMGYGVFPPPKEDILKQKDTQTCVRISDIAAFRSIDYGFYYQNDLNVNLHKIIVADNQVSIFPMVIGPNPLTHECGDQRVDVTDSILIGSTDNCANMQSPSGVYMTNSGHCRGDKGPNGARLGLLFPQITGGGNGAPFKPCGNIMSYNPICGGGSVTGTVFAHFGQCSYALSLSTNNDDLQFYLSSSSNLKVDVDDNFLLYYPRPTVGKINPADCVDMDCDAMKKALLRDDGTLAGSPAYFIPKSEWQWGGDPRRGLNDARVPKDMLTFPNGTVITVDQLAPNGRGISRVAGQCTLKGSASTFEYYKCANVKYELLVIESLDADTETRRLSPVAILQDGYIDLINGPQDHGWCNGYTCQKRVSLFHALVRPGLPVSVYLTSVQPDKMRYFMMDGQADSCVVVSFYYQNPNRIDVYTDGGSHYELPKNGKYETKGGKQIFKLLNDPGVDYIPTCSDPHGSNYIDRDARLQYFVLKGNAEIQLSKANVVIVSFGLPAMTVEEFFGANIVENLAAMLNIPLEKVRVVSIVSSAGSGRKRRSTSTLAVVLEIGDEPPASATDNTEPVVDIADLVMTACQDGSLDTSLSTSGIQCEEIIIGGHVYQPVEPAGLRFLQTLKPSHEGVPFTVQPKVRAYDDNDNLIDNMGIVEDPWKITATLRAGTGHANAVLGGTVTVTTANGWANFTDLQISHKGSGYIIDFQISYPLSAAALNLKVSTDPFDVMAVPLTSGVHSMTMDNIVTNEVMTLTLELRDSTTNKPIPDINWRGHTFAASCDTLMEFEEGSLTGTLSGQFEPSTGHVAFTDWRFTGYGLVYISCQVESVPAEYDFYSFHKVVVLSPAQDAIVVTANSIVTVRYNLDYDLTLPDVAAAKQLEQATVNYFNKKYPEIIISDSSISKGSIIVTFTVEGRTANVTSVLSSICTDISAGTPIQIASNNLTLDGYMLVDGTDYYSSCTSESKKEGLHPGYIALIVILCLLVVAAVVFIVVYKVVIKPKSKTHDESSHNPADRRTGFYYIDNGRTVFLAAGLTGKHGFYTQTQAAGRPESSAPPITTLYDETPGYTIIRRSPLPPDTDAEVAMKRAVTPTD
ncbi:fibrocystin-L-like isoform X3 [Dreissena polymorpha]|uniref:fibrocystin-L-like isoform X3 n=1 Tax=Dreissena polymorpha TaxID=45954 RepID=UPI0022650D67|nr:fibrocystin-L-like isoform X3 [Dreissena polymorpha]